MLLKKGKGIKLPTGKEMLTITEKDVIESAPKHYDESDEKVMVSSGKIVKSKDAPREELKEESTQKIEDLMGKVGAMETIAALLTMGGGKGGKRPQRQVKPYRKARFARRRQMRREERRKGRKGRSLRAKAKAAERIGRTYNEAKVEKMKKKAMQTRDKFMDALDRMDRPDAPYKGQALEQLARIFNEHTRRLANMGVQMGDPKTAAESAKDMAATAQDFTIRFERGMADPGKVKTRYHQEMLKSEIENMKRMQDAFMKQIEDYNLPRTKRGEAAVLYNQMNQIIEMAKNQLQKEEFEPAMPMGADKKDMN
jgi:hypothetical protein